MSKAISDAVEVLRLFLAEDHWAVEPVAGRHAFKATGEDELAPLLYYFQVVEQEQFLFYIQPQLTLLPEMLPSVAEFIARANFGMRIGNFELDYSEAAVCFRSGVNFKGTGLTAALISGAVEPALAAYDEFFPGLARVIAGLDTPAKAIQSIEYGDPDDA
jgi:hypothetical protein